MRLLRAATYCSVRRRCQLEVDMTFPQLFATRSNIASSEEVVELTNQFYVTLRAYFARVKQNPVRNQVAFDRVAQLVDAGTVQNWTNAYEIEQLLVHLFDDETVAAELGR